MTGPNPWGTRRRAADAPNRQRRTRLLPAGAVVAGVLLAGACGDEGVAGGPTTPRTSASSRPPTAGAPGTPSAPPADDGVTPPASSSAAPTRCTRDQLGLSLGRISPGAGNRYAPLVFTNTGSSPCSLQGYPGVTLLDSSGHRIGEPAKRQGPDSPSVTLKPGSSAHASLHTVAQGVTDKPCRRPAEQVQAYPPGSTWALRAPAHSKPAMRSTSPSSATVTTGTPTAKPCSPSAKPSGMTRWASVTSSAFSTSANSSMPKAPSRASHPD
ncbi:DUF4232 domain-containing protein [Streptomyces albicerus]|uniref:DUF4232 domain-containing protein n=1 Tax=Streptomyces albicerus TaxID=2569859 RepID=UPI00124B3C35